MIRYINYHLHYIQCNKGRHGCDCMVVGFTTTCAISAYMYITTTVAGVPGENHRPAASH